MLKLFRDNLRSLSWVLWTVIAVFVLLVFVDVGAFAPQGPEEGRNARAAWAGDMVVTFGEYEQLYRQYEDRQRQMFQGEVPEAIRNQLKIQALEGAFDQKLLVAEARDLGLQVSDQELREAILGFEVFTDQDGRFIGEERYRNFVRRFGYATPQAFEESLRDDLLSGKLTSLLHESVFVSDAEVEQSFREQSERAKVRYVLLPTRDFADAVSVDEAELASYFEQHKEEYRLPEQRRIAYLVVDNSALRAKMEVTPEEIQAYYDAHTSDYEQNEQVRARHILIKTDERTPEEAEEVLAAARARITGGETFDAVAREVSEDPGSASNGGDLRFAPRGRWAREFEEAAFGAQVGELVGPVRTPFGVHLLEVTGRREGGLRPLEEVRAQVRHRVLAERVEEEGQRLAGELLARLREAGGTGEQELQAVADELDYVQLLVTEPFGQQDVVPGIGRSPEFSAASFAVGQGELSEPVKLPRGWAVLTLKEELEPRIPELSAVEAEVRQAVRTEKQQQMARERLQQARQSLSAGGDLESVAADLGVEVKESEQVNRGGAIPELGQSSPKVIDAALAMEEGDFGGPIDVAQGAVLFQVAERTHMDPAELEQREEQIRQTLEARQFQRVLASVLSQRKLEMNVQYAKQIVDETTEDAPLQ